MLSDDVWVDATAVLPDNWPEHIAHFLEHDFGLRLWMTQLFMPVRWRSLL
jgi:hypothetical protein